MGLTNFKFVYLSPNGGIINGGNPNSAGETVEVAVVRGFL
jgi:hypothetical protein